MRFRSEEGGARTHDDRIMSRLNSVSERVYLRSHISI